LLFIFLSFILTFPRTKRLEAGTEETRDVSFAEYWYYNERYKVEIGNIT